MEWRGGEEKVGDGSKKLRNHLTTRFKVNKNLFVSINPSHSRYELPLKLDTAKH